MELKTLSASSALVFEDCQARWFAEYAERARQPSGSPAALGTACHSTAQQLIEEEWHTKGYVDPATIQAIYDVAYWENFSDNERYDEGLELVRSWWERADWAGRTVLSTEQKLNFELKTSVGPIPFNFIFDRCDRLADGSIEVVDYKTWMKPVQPGNMKRKIQVRAYGVAAAILYPEAPQIWITLDQWRYEPVSCRFTRDENLETWRYLNRLAERIIAAEPDEHGNYPETLNADCRYCVRRSVCGELAKHERVGGSLGITDPFAAADRRYRLESAKAAIDVLLGELDEVILNYCESEETLDYTTGAVDVAITASKKRVIDPMVAAQILGPQMAAEFPGGIKIGVIDKLMKEKPCRLSDDQIAQLKAATRKEFGEARVTTAPADPVLGEAA